MTRFLPLLALATLATATWVDPSVLDACPGYKATNVEVKGSSLSADLSLAGTPCNVFGQDIAKLKLEVTYETG
jgi:alpha-glucosidase